MEASVDISLYHLADEHIPTINEFIGGRWEMTEQGHKLRSRLSNEIVDLYAFYLNKYQVCSF